MATNFSVSDAGIQAWIESAGVEVNRYRRLTSAVVSAVQAAGGQTFDGLAPVQTSIPVTSGQTPIEAVAESTVALAVDKPASGRTATSMDLLVKAHAEIERVTDQALRAQLFGPGGQDGFSARLAAEKLPAIWAGFDKGALTPLVAGATSVEYDAADPVGSLSSVVAPYDDTAYGADAMILTRAGARKLRYAKDANGLVQFGSDVPFDGPVFTTDLTGTDLGSATLMGIVGPFGSCAVGQSGDTLIKTFDQLEPTNGGAGQNIISFLVERYAGFVAPPVSVVPATGWTILVDAA